MLQGRVLSNPMRWSAVGKALSVAGIVDAFALYYYFRTNYLLAHGLEEPYLDRAVLPVLQDSLAVAIPVWSILLGLVAFVGRSRPTSRMLVRLAILPAWLAAATQTYLFGFFTSLAPITLFLIGIPSLLSFDERTTSMGLGVFFASVLGTTVAEQQGWLRYAPLFTRLPLEQGQPTRDFATLTMGVFFSSVFIVFGMLFLQIRRWREYDARLEQLSMSDSLTGLLNRRAFLARFRTEVERAIRYGRPLSYILIDLDHFKWINDTHGHPVGDNVLTAVSAVLCGAVRANDVVGRLGGEEFGILLPETNLAGASEVAERCRQSVASTVVRADTAEVEVKVTLSMGIATYPECDGHTVEDIVRLADAALYRAKSMGRNRVEPAVLATNSVRTPIEIRKPR